MNSGHRATLEAIFAAPVRASIRWAEIESLFHALGADVEEERGSPVRVLLNGVVAVFHRPHRDPVIQLPMWSCKRREKRWQRR